MKHGDEQLIEADLVLERGHEILLKDSWNDLGQHLLGDPSVSAITSGLTTASGAGLSVDTAAGSLLQAQGNDYMHVIETDPTNSVLTAADPTDPRIDIIQSVIKVRAAYQDSTEQVVDAYVPSIGPLITERDWEYYLDISAVTGTPAPSPVVPVPDAGSAGSVTGTVTTDVLDCSIERNLRVAFGNDGEFLLVDIAGATPSATTLLERIAALNAAFTAYGVVASDVGGALKLADITTGFDSQVRFRQPLDPDTDALTLVLGLIELPNYYYSYRGENAGVKLAEVTVIANATVIDPPFVKDISVKSSWQTPDSNVLLPSFRTHRDSDPIDHPDESIGLIKLKPEVKTGLTLKLTNLRGPHAVIYPVPGDVTGGKLATLMQRDVEIFTELGASQSGEDQEQEFPVNRVDQEQSDVSGPDYVCQVALTETALDKILFVPDGDYFFTDAFNRLGVYVNTVGSGYTHLRFDLHDSGNTQQSFVEIPIGDLTTGWIYAEFPASIVPGATYHGHAYCVGFTAGSTTRLATATGGTQVSFRELYLPTGGKFGTAATSDVVHFLNPDGTEIVAVRLTGDDDILVPGDGFIGETGYDVMSANLSNQTFWENAEHREFILIDLLNGRVKLPAPLAFGTAPDPIYAEYNLQEGQDAIDARNVLLHRHGPNGPSVDDAIRWDWDPDADAIRTDQQVGIKDNPDEALVVNGNMKISGRINDYSGTGIAGYLIGGTPFYTKSISITLASGIGSDQVPHGISNAYSSHRIINVFHIWDDGSRDYWFNDPGLNPFSPQVLRWDDTYMLLQRTNTGSAATWTLWITYI